MILEVGLDLQDCLLPMKNLPREGEIEDFHSYQENIKSEPLEIAGAKE